MVVDFPIHRRRNAVPLVDLTPIDVVGTLLTEWRSLLLCLSNGS